MAPRLALVPELEAELDRLYALPLDEFTAARNELDSRLRKTGQEEAAQAVRGLRKPTLPLWTVNQLARRHPAELEALVDAGERLRRAQESAFRGEDPEGLREATAAERAALRALRRLAEHVLMDEGRAATQSMLERVASTLRSAVLDPDAAALLSAGRLTAEPEASGFAALAALVPPAGDRSGRKGRRRQDDLAVRRARERERRGLQKRIDRLEHQAAAAAESAERADRAAAAAHERVAEAQAELGAAKEDLRRLGPPSR